MRATALRAQPEGGLARTKEVDRRVVRREVLKVKKPGVRHWLGLIVLALPAVFFVPGIGFEASNPSALARSSAAPSVWYYRVRTGDSLTTIAERELGTFRRFKEVLALNPGIKPRSLQVGDVLRMPLRDGRSVSSGVIPSAPTVPAADIAPAGPDGRRLLLSIAGLLALVVLIVLIAGRLDRRAYTT